MVKRIQRFEQIQQLESVKCLTLYSVQQLSDFCYLRQPPLATTKTRVSTMVVTQLFRMREWLSRQGMAMQDGYG